MKDSDPLGKIKAGVPMTHDQKEALRKANAQETTDAHNRAAEARARDEREKPLGQILQDSIKKKLEDLPPAPAEELTPPTA